MGSTYVEFQEAMEKAGNIIIDRYGKDTLVDFNKTAKELVELIEVEMKAISTRATGSEK